MSKNVPPTKPRLKRSLRIQQIIIGLKKGLSYQQIAEKCGCTEKTIDRDIDDWKENGGFDKWLLSEFLRLHQQEIGKEEGGQAYKVTADLLKKRLKEQQEVTLETGSNFVVQIVDNSKEPEQEAQEATDNL